MLVFIRHVYHGEFCAPGEGLGGSRGAVRRSVQRARELVPGSHEARRARGTAGILKRASCDDFSYEPGQRVQKLWHPKINVPRLVSCACPSSGC